MAENKQLDELDAEIAELEQAVTGESQQPEQSPEQVASGQQPEQPKTQEVDVITSVDEFEGTSQEREPTQGQEQAVANAEAELEEAAEQPLHEEADAGSGRRSWKNDYLELENRYVKLRSASDNFKFEARQQIATLQERLAASQDEVAALQEKLAQLEGGSGNIDLSGAFSQEDMDVLGEGSVQSLQKAISTAVESATAPLKMELLQMKKKERDQLKAQAQTNRSQASMSFRDQLGRLVPNYQQINVDKRFIEWLRQPSPYSGVPRIDFFRKAEASGDVERVAQYFIEFEQVMTAPQQKLQQSVTPSGRSGGHAPQPQKKDEPKVFSRAFIEKFYDDDINGKYQGREALRDRLDKEIDLALKEGRVV